VTINRDALVRYTVGGSTDHHRQGPTVQVAMRDFTKASTKLRRDEALLCAASLALTV